VRTNRCYVLGLSAAGLLMLLLAPSSAGAKNMCNASHSSNIASDNVARVYGKHGHVFACLNRNGKTWKLAGAAHRRSHFALAGKWVAWTKSVSEGEETLVAKLFIPDGQAHDTDFPYPASGDVGKVAIKSDGAVAYAASYDSAAPNVFGEKRMNRLSLLSNDSNSVVVSSLTSGPGKAVTWKYDGGRSGEATLY
jgi:hypothetical protein